MEADFSGYATKAGLKCTDGRTIMPDAFKHQDKAKVPLVWQHGHNDPENVLGHAILEARPDGVYAYGFFNSSGKASHAKDLLEHGDINMLSIWANDLIERTGRVLHGAIREVSLVLSGANPGALIENVTIKHSDGDEFTLEDEVIIYTGLELQHAEGDAPSDAKDDEPEDNTDDEETIEDVYETMTDKQKEVLHYMIGEALLSAEDNNTETGEMAQDNVTTNDTDKEGDKMTRNVFEQGDESKPEAPRTLSHADIEGIVSDATKLGSLKDAVDAFALQHGITDIDLLFPDAQNIATTPEWFTRRTEWVNKLLSATRKSPFSRVKTMSADLTPEEARAKGYITGTLKKEEFFGVSKRVTTPTTIYKKQKLDRDDMVDITDFDVVTWLKGEMRLMLDEELARAILIGDGRDVAHDDKINEQNIRPIAKDHELYTTVVNVNIDDANSSVQEIIDAIVMNRQYWKGTGLPTMYTTETYIAKFLLLKDTVGRRIYKTLDEVATELRVAEIVPVEVMEEEDDIVAILVNPVDYIIGADKGGNVSMFDDFDIDYNQYKYLIETRVSGALTKLKSAMVVKKVAASLVAVTPAEPAFDGSDITITNQTGVVYQDASDDSTMNAAGSPYSVAEGETFVVNAVPASGYYFPSSENDSWTFVGE
jgi:hypothetical protein